MKKQIEQSLLTLSQKPGVYLMKNKLGEIIYIGKAKNLKNRVSQYFLRPQAGRVAAMVFEVEDFATIITKNEKEAFILEMNLIKEHYPRFNILLKDDKHYPYIALRKKKSPVLKITRNDLDKNFFYFGPFPTSTHAYEIINLLNKIFPLQKCKVLPKIPCLYYHLGQCLAPCINEIDEETHRLIYEQIKAFLSGDNLDVYHQIEEKMLQASENQEYEKAHDYKKTLFAIKHLNEQQKVEVQDRLDRDIFAYTIREGYLALALLTFRRGLLLGKEVFVVPQFGRDIDLVGSLILQYYQTHSLPHEIIVNIASLKRVIEAVYDVKVLTKSHGTFYDLVEMASTNARQGLDEHFMSARLSDDHLKTLSLLGDLLKIETPFYIELFDNSHLQGTSQVSAMVAFINGEPSKKLYRRFHLEDAKKGDDLTSIKEVVYRRYKRLKDQKLKMPHLILVDGGLQQVKAAQESLNKLSLKIPCFGLYKNKRHQTEGIISDKDQIFKIDNKPLFFLLTRMQDEVHRFALAFHQQTRTKKMKRSILDNIEGLGPKRQALLLRTYPSLNELKKVSLFELEQLLPKSVAKNVFDKLKEVNNL